MTKEASVHMHSGRSVLRVESVDEAIGQHANLLSSAWFKTGLFWVTQTIGILLPGEGGLDAEMKKTGRVSNRFRVQLKGVETL